MSVERVEATEHRRHHFVHRCLAEASAPTFATDPNCATCHAFATDINISNIPEIANIPQNTDKLIKDTYLYIKIN